MGELGYTKGSILAASQSTRLGALVAGPSVVTPVAPQWIIMVWVDETRHTYYDVGGEHVQWVEDVEYSNASFERLRAAWELQHGDSRPPVSVILWHVAHNFEYQPGQFLVRWEPVHGGLPQVTWLNDSLGCFRDDPATTPPGSNAILNVNQLINRWEGAHIDSTSRSPVRIWSVLDNSRSMQREDGSNAIHTHYHSFLAYLQQRHPDAHISGNELYTDGQELNERWAQWAGDKFDRILALVEP
jgi:hypothetical protein